MHAQVVTTIKGLLYTDGTPVSIEIADGKIVQIDRLNSNEEVIHHFIAPGLIDVQINGYAGVDFSGPDLTVEAVEEATKTLWKAGVTTYFPTVITSSIDRIRKNFAILAEAKASSETRQSISGFHLEGPYISPIKGFRGAHLAKYIKGPDWEEFESLQSAARRDIRLITVAPEMNGAIPFIQKCVESGIVVSLGHHNGSAAEIQRAVAAGARMVTHLGNGCANEINRHYNPLWPQLSNDLLIPSIIADGFHLTRDEIRTFFKVKGHQNLLLVSDALDLAGLPPGEYVRGERKLLLTEDVVKLPDQDVLAGAASPISKCVGVVMDYTQCSLQQAIQMASSNPAKMFGLADRGEIAPGRRADLILFTIENKKIEIQQTFVEGALVYSK